MQLALALPEWMLPPNAIDPGSAALALLVTVVLACGIAWLHRFTARGAGHTQDYSHTLVMISVVTAALIMVVSRSVSIGLAMFAAFSLIRFPSSVGRSMDLAFAFFAIAVGMVAGSGHYFTAAFVTLLGAGVIFYLHSRNAFAPKRSSHMLTVSLAADSDFQSILSPVFANHTLESRLMATVPQDGGDRTLVRYGVVLKDGTRLPVLVEALHEVCGNHRILLEPTDQTFDLER